MPFRPISPHAPGWPPDWPDVPDPRVIEAIRAVPRHRFVSPELYGEAYQDAPLPIGHGQTISQPYIVALMSQALALTPESRVLEIGTGSGYQAAILAHLTPYVWSIETIPELAERAGRVLHDLGHQVQIRVGDGLLGWPEHAPYDAIMVAAAGSVVPVALVEQLADCGRLVLPIGEEVHDQVLWLIRKHRGGRLEARRLADVRFVPLVATTSRQLAPDPERERLQRELRELVHR